jgi:hypothetical protein
MDDLLRLLRERPRSVEKLRFKTEEVKKFRFYFVSENTPTYYGERADKDSRIKGGTITVRPRWPERG